MAPGKQTLQELKVEFQANKCWASFLGLFVTKKKTTQKQITLQNTTINSSYGSNGKNSVFHLSSGQTGQETFSYFTIFMFS